jgi:hypothetical protein
MDLNFLIPAATFVVASGFVMALLQWRDGQASSAPWTVRDFAAMMVPGAVSALVAWAAYRVAVTYFGIKQSPERRQTRRRCGLVFPTLEP